MNIQVIKMVIILIIALDMIPHSLCTVTSLFITLIHLIPERLPDDLFDAPIISGICSIEFILSLIVLNVKWSLLKKSLKRSYKDRLAHCILLI